MKDKTCVDCYYYKYADYIEDSCGNSYTGFCKRYPPVYQGSDFFGYVLVCSINELCGEYKDK